MEYLEPAAYALWKAELMAGRIDQMFAGRVGDVLGRLHAAGADPSILGRFPNAKTFHDIRIEPYLLHPVAHHSDLRTPLEALAKGLASRPRVLIHGDASPKNLLRSPAGAPVFLDAECATAGDPAFDLAFCLNHLLLKGRLFPAVDRNSLRARRVFAVRISSRSPGKSPTSSRRVWPVCFRA